MRKVISFLFVLPFLAYSVPAQADESAYFNRIVDAIFLAEGGNKAKVPYGILSVKTSNPRKVCYNTVRNNFERWIDSGAKEPFIDFLARRYAPIGASNDPKGLNRHWAKNVRYWEAVNASA